MERHASFCRLHSQRSRIWPGVPTFIYYRTIQREFILIVSKEISANTSRLNSQYSLMFPGESELLQASSTKDLQQQYLAKDSVSALYCRLMLLWCSCLRMQHNALAGFDVKEYTPEELESRQAEFAIQAWLESSVIESALDRHSCRKDQLAIYASRNWIFGYVGFLALVMGVFDL